MFLRSENSLTTIGSIGGTTTRVYEEVEYEYPVSRYSHCRDEYDEYGYRRSHCNSRYYHGRPVVTNRRTIVETHTYKPYNVRIVKE